MQTKDFRGMPHRRMGNSGLWVSEVGLSLQTGAASSNEGSPLEEEQVFEILDRALELGVTHWDAANPYEERSGNGERLMGRYFESRGPRAREFVVLATKVQSAVPSEGESEYDFTPNQRGASRKYILQAVEDSLQRLKTDYIDILYHRAPALMPDGSYETPLDELWDTFDILVQQGKVRYLAVSNRAIEHLEADRQALAAVAPNPARRIIAVQNRYNILQRPQVAALDDEPTIEDEQAFLDYLVETQVSLVPYRPLAAGLLTGRYQRQDPSPSRQLSQKVWDDDFLTDRNLKLVGKLKEFAEDKQCTLAQLAIAWLLAHDAVCSVIAGVTKLSQLEQKAQAHRYSFTPTEMAKLDDWTGGEEEEEEEEVEEEEEKDEERKSSK